MLFFYIYSVLIIVPITAIETIICYSLLLLHWKGNQLFPFFSLNNRTIFFCIYSLLIILSIVAIAKIYYFTTKGNLLVSLKQSYAFLHFYCIGNVHSCDWNKCILFFLFIYSALKRETYCCVWSNPMLFFSLYFVFTMLPIVAIETTISYSIYYALKRKPIVAL